MFGQYSCPGCSEFHDAHILAIGLVRIHFLGNLYHLAAAYLDLHFFIAIRIILAITNQKRVLIYDASTGAYKRGWGGHGMPLSEVSNKELPGYTWTGGIYSDRVARLNLDSGEWMFYLLPFQANIRDINLQPAAAGGLSGLWVGHTHEAMITLIEPLAK